MSEIVKAIILGIVQGATEFIPVSSSGHLVIVPWLMGWAPSSLLFDTVLHWGTLLSIGVIFWQDFLQMIGATLRSIGTRSLADMYARLGWFIIVGSIPAAVTGLLFKDFFEALFASPTAAALFLLVTAFLLISSELMMRYAEKLRTLETMNWLDAILIGLFQAVALAPGISRSGTTMAAGLARGIRREDAARYSFLLGTPAFFGAGLLQLLQAMDESPGQLAAEAPMLVLGFVASAISGFIAIRFLLAYLRKHRLYPFAVYCIIVSIIVLGLSMRQ
ncbi:MAG: undecaprenyl-diphosphatase UppP [Calditrichaeota bacterium]|nr:undecaprenyl-diphosphatase UppP [Calditrichota bacterium]